MKCSPVVRGATSSLQLQIWRQTSFVAVVNDRSESSSHIPLQCTPPPDGPNIVFINIVKDPEFDFLSFLNSFVD